ncbi:DNA primase family protein [Nonomuraea rhizosphaerae]|uniref:DNA primase family protein n=1 Tax=Nonomuraea rhizosphaerae TaxID=2665663 RepID=UPI001C5EE42F|nr:phage/plasmid primase, P4 family [Nonomuraea rhizosphaerae]
MNDPDFSDPDALQAYVDSLTRDDPSWPDAPPADSPDDDVKDAAGHGDVSDSVLVDQVADAVLVGKFRWCPGLGWLRWDGKRWAAVDESLVHEVVRLHLAAQFGQRTAAAGPRLNQGRLKELLGMLSAAKVRNVTTLARGVEGIHVDPADLDADPDLLNTPAGVVNLRTGQLGAHDPALLMTKMTRGSYRPGYRHPDWMKALDALPCAECEWFQVRIGQAVTGHANPDGILVVMQGGGENGKTLITTDSLVAALGDYADVASHKLLSPGNEHSEEMASLRGQRFLVSEEMTEGRALNVTAIKRIMDVGVIRARHVYKSNMTFPATHSLFATTNYLPVVNETDHGTWRRLALLRFPYTFRKPGEECRRPDERQGDPGLKARIKANRSGQQDAIVTWVVEGAMRWYADPDTSMSVTKTVAADTRAWRAEADRVLGFWDEQLVADRAALVLTTDMLEAFNTWLVGNGHKMWSKELFHPRFKTHTETARHGVAERRTKRLDGLVRYRDYTSPLSVPDPLPKQPVVYVGVRFRTEDDPIPEESETDLDQGEDPKLQTLQTSSELSASHVGHQKVPEGSARSATSPPTSQNGRCEACREPMTIVEPGQTRHPLCETDE